MVRIRRGSPGMSPLPRAATPERAIPVAPNKLAFHAARFLKSIGWGFGNHWRLDWKGEGVAGEAAADDDNIRHNGLLVFRCSANRHLSGWRNF